MSQQFNFPANPNVGDTFTMPNGITAQWNGTEWVSVGDSTSTVTYPLPLNLGGTGANAAPQARINLGLNAATGEFIVQKDGTVTNPGMAFVTEPGLGFYRFAANKLGLAVAGSTPFTWEADNPAATVSRMFSRQAAGAATFSIGMDPPATANTVFLNLSMSGTGAGITVVKQGSAATKPLSFTGASLYGFDGPIVNNAGQLTLGNGVGSGTMTLNPVASAGKDIAGQSAGSNRWLMRLGEGMPGDDFVLWAYDNDGSTLHERLRINRLNGSASMQGNFAVPANITSSGGSVFSSGGFGFSAGGGNTDWRIVREGNVIRQYFTNSVTHRLDYDQSTGNFSFATDGGTLLFDNGANMAITGGYAAKAGGGPWAAPSDIALKTNVRDYAQGLDAVLALRPRQYAYKTDPITNYVGLVYQEVDSMPEMKSVDSNGMGQLDTGPVTWALVNAVKTLNARLAALEH